MSTQSLQVLQSSLPAVPVAVVLAQKLLSHTVSVGASRPAAPAEDEDALVIRANQLTATLKCIRGYDHYGIND